MQTNIFLLSKDRIYIGNANFREFVHGMNSL